MIDISDQTAKPLFPKTEEYLRRIIETCKSHNIEVALLCTPSMKNPWNGVPDSCNPQIVYVDDQSYYITIRKIADEYQIRMFDYYNANSPNYGVRFEKDDFYTDGYHLNPYGGRKLTLSLGEQLSKNYNLEDHRGDERYSSWDRNAENMTRDRLLNLYNVDLNILEKYTLGTKLSFQKDKIATQYAVKGFGENEGAFTWTDGSQSVMVFPLNCTPQSDLLFHMDIAQTCNGGQTVLASAGGENVYFGEINGAGAIEFMIPKELLMQRVLVITFDFPNAAPLSVLGEGEGDGREFALALTGMCLQEIVSQ